MKAKRNKCAFIAHTNHEYKFGLVKSNTLGHHNVNGFHDIFVFVSLNGVVERVVVHFKNRRPK